MSDENEAPDTETLRRIGAGTDGDGITLLTRAERAFLAAAADWIDAHLAADGPVPTPPADAELELLAALVDPDECSFDHHGGCQAHGFLSLEPGEVCPNEQAKRLLAADRSAGTE